jgi:hypothetical protein
MTQRSDISGMGFRHMPSAVGRHFGESCIGPPVIRPVPSAKRTREVVRPSSMSICQGRPSATLAANDTLGPDSRADAAVNCIIAPAIMRSTHVALPKVPTFELSDDERTNGPVPTAATSFALMTMNRDEPTVRSAPGFRLKFRRGFHCRHRGYCDDYPEQQSDCHRSDSSYLECSAAQDVNTKCRCDESRR